MSSRKIVTILRVLLVTLLLFILQKSSIAHLSNPYQFLGTIYDYSLLPEDIVVYFTASVPFAELGLAGMLVFRETRRSGAKFSMVLFAAYVAAQLVVLRRGDSIACGCFGNDDGRLVGTVSLGIATGCGLSSGYLYLLESGYRLRKQKITASTLRPGVTLLELLIVLAMIGILIGLLLGAVQRVRQSGDRVRCENQLRQLALGLHQYHDAERRLPAGITNFRAASGGAWDEESGISWSARILPFVDQDPVWREYRAQWPGADAIAAVKIAALRCPTDPVERTPSGVFSDGSPWPISGAMSYVGVAGSRDHSRPTKRNGVLFRGSAISWSGVTDGTSHTLLLAERHGVDSLRTGVWSKPRGGGHSASYAHVLGTQEPRDATLFGTCSDRPGHFEPGRSDDECSLTRYWSHHSGGANFAFCDGSVRFLTYVADAILPALATRAGREIVEIP